MILSKKLQFLLILILIHGLSADFFDDEQESKTTSKLSFKGSLEVEGRYYEKKSKMEVNPHFNLGIDYKGESSSLSGEFQYDDDQQVEIKTLFFRYYFDNFDLLIGKNKIVWGKGDKVHLFNHINPEDFSDFINKEYLERKVGEYMVKLDYYLNSATLEFVYTPHFNPNIFNEEGRWVPKQIRDLQDFMHPLKKYFIDKGMSLLELKELEKYTSFPKYEKLRHGQAGLRFTNSWSGYDYGFSVYKGRFRKPSIDGKMMSHIKTRMFLEKNDPHNPLLQTIPNMEVLVKEINPHYDLVTIFGFEMASVLATVNTRFEAAFFLSDQDFEGKKYDVHNNKCSFLLGVDRNIGLHNINANLQVKGEYILQKDKIRENTYIYNPKVNIDVDFDKRNNYYSHMLIARVKDDFLNENFMWEIKGSYLFEDKSLLLSNEFEYKLHTDISFFLTYKRFMGKRDTDIGQFRDNNYIALSAKYSF